MLANRCLDPFVGIVHQSKQGILNLRQRTSHIVLIQANVMLMQNISLWRSVVQDSPQHSITQTQLLAHGRHLLA
jgi:hypothetical protein